MELKVKGQRVLITAGAGGIGRVMAETFVEAGARVHICDVVKSALDETVKALGVTATLCDVSDLKQVDQLFADAKKQLNGLDVLVNNAGIAGPTGKVEEISVEDWRRCIDIDLNGMFYCTRLADASHQGGAGRLDHQSVFGGGPFGLSLPHAVRGCEVGGGRLHQELVDGGGHRQYPRQRDPAWRRRRRAHGSRDRGQSQGDRDQLRCAEKDLARAACR